MWGGVDSVFDIWGSFLYIHTHTQHTQPTLLAAYICYHGDERLGMMALRLVRAGVKTGDVQLASKYSSRCLHGCFQHPYFGKLGEHLTRRRPALRLFPSTLYERFTHATAGIKVPLTPVWASPVRSSTTEEESASEYSLPASDLFMRANKAIRWENLPSGRSMCVFCATECWKVPRRDPFPASWLLWGAGISLCQKLVRFRVYIYPHLCPPPPRVGLQSLVRERRSPLRLKESVCNWNRSYSSLIAQTLSGRGWGGGAGSHPPHGQTVKHLVFCGGIIMVAPVYTRPPWIKTKQDTLGDLIRLAVPHRLTAALSHSPLFSKCERVCPDVWRSDLRGVFWRAHTGQQCWEIPAVTPGLS